MLRRAQQSNHPTKIVVVVANFTSKSSFFYYTLHFKGEEVFGSTKQPANCLRGVNNEFHHPYHVNFSRAQITVIVVQPNVVENVGMQQLPCCYSVYLPLVSQGGLKLKENICVDG